MRIIKLFTRLVLALFLSISFTTCSDDDLKDKVDTITITVSSETDVMYDWGDSEGKHPIECMKVKIGTSSDEWQKMGFSTIEGFDYVVGYEYYLSVLRTTLSNPPADGSSYTYKLKEIISRKLVYVYPDVPVLTDESQIEYEVESPDHFYDIWNNEITVDGNGNLSHNQQDDSFRWLPYEKAIVYMVYVLPKTDHRWSKLKYMPTNAYIISPFSNKIKNEDIISGSIMFKEIVSIEEFQRIKSDVKTGESISYYIILTNAWGKAIQKTELKIRKI